MLASIVLGVLIVVVSTGLFVAPRPRVRTLLVVVREILTVKGPSWRARLSMFGFILAELARLPVHALFAFADELFARGYRNVSIEAPIFVIGQPRSGTTFLLRTLAEDDGRVVSAQHLEWRYPSVVFWRLLSWLGLRNWLEQRSYWPLSELGQLCDRVHAHRLGNHEELGIFLEERLWRHYFLFRRFPFPRVLESLCTYSSLDARERIRMLDAVEGTMKKILFHRGIPGAIFLTKENELADFHRDLLERFPDARLVFVTRDSRDVLASYRTMSDVCTRVKHGVEPTCIAGWTDSNLQFRLDEARHFVSLANDVLADPDRLAIAVRYEDLVSDIGGTVRRIHDALKLPLSETYAARLDTLDRQQRTRRSGYRNTSREADARFAFLDRFAASIASISLLDTPSPSTPSRLDTSPQAESGDTPETTRSTDLEHAA